LFRSRHWPANGTATAQRPGAGHGDSTRTNPRYVIDQKCTREHGRIPAIAETLPCNDRRLFANWRRQWPGPLSTPLNVLLPLVMPSVLAEMTFEIVGNNHRILGECQRASVQREGSGAEHICIGDSGQRIDECQRIVGRRHCQSTQRDQVVLPTVLVMVTWAS